MAISNPRSFCCIFHNDHKPSASIHRALFTDHYLLTCNGACKHTWDIIGLVQHKYRVSYLDACKMLFYIFNITVLQPISIQNGDYTAKLQENLLIISDLSKYPLTYKILTQNYTTYSPLDILTHLTEYALDLHQNKQDLRDSNGYPIFFISVRELLRRLTGEKAFASGKHSAKLTLLCYFGLLERIPDRDLIPEALERSNSPECDYRKGNPERFKNSRGNRISFYRIPILTPELLDHIETHAAVNWSRWYSISNISYNKIRITEGKRIADKIYAGRNIRHKSIHKP